MSGHAVGRRTSPDQLVATRPVTSAKVLSVETKSPAPLGPDLVHRDNSPCQRKRAQ